MALVEMYMNSKVMPALARIGVVPADYEFKWEIAEDTSELWKRTVEALNHFDVDPEWVKEKFGIAIIGKKEAAPNPTNGQFNIAESFFV